ncbi:TIGR04150 pseudo-rSAM protein [Thermodesulfobacteriota bacterium]
MEKTFWFYLEPYVHISHKSSDCLLYNSLSGLHLVYWDKPKVSKILRRLSHPANQRVIRLGPTEMTDQEVCDFTEKVRQSYIGDILDTAYSSGKPALMPQRPKLDQEAKKLKKEEGRSVGEGVLEYLLQLSIHVNSQCREKCAGCAGYYKQFSCCTRMPAGREELDFSTISNLLDQIEWSSVSLVNIVGGDIFLYSRLRPLAELLKTKAFETHFYLHYLHLSKNHGNISSLSFDNSKITLVVSPPYSQEHLAKALDKAFQGKPETKVLFVVESEEDIRRTEEFIAAKGLSSYAYKPFFNGKNRAFFEHNVFMDMEDIFKARPSQKEIYANMFLNRLQFGRLTVLSNRKIYANLNDPSLGTLDQENIYQVLYREMDLGKSWLRTRGGVRPCRGCILNAVCPPLGNYEKALKKNDLCHVSGHLKERRKSGK